MPGWIPGTGGGEGALSGRGGNEQRVKKGAA
jgi:hypothetical protein